MDNYQIIEDMGTGYFGKSFKVRHALNGNLYKMKLMECSNNDEASRLFYEMQRFQRVLVQSKAEDLNKLNPIQCYFVHLDQSASKAYFCIASDYVITDSLHTLCQICFKTGKIFPYEMIIQVCGQLVSTVTYMKNIGLTHRHLKATNVLTSLTGDQFVPLAGTLGATARIVIKLTDFALPSLIKQVNQQSVTGGFYTSREEFEEYYDEDTDNTLVYNVGSILLQLMSCRYLTTDDYYLRSQQIQHDSSLLDNMLQSCSKLYEPDLIEMVRWMLRTDVSQRPRLDELTENVFVRNCMDKTAESSPNMSEDEDNNGEDAEDEEVLVKWSETMKMVKTECEVKINFLLKQEKSLLAERKRIQDEIVSADEYLQPFLLQIQQIKDHIDPILAKKDNLSARITDIDKEVENVTEQKLERNNSLLKASEKLEELNNALKAIKMGKKKKTIK